MKHSGNMSARGAFVTAKAANTLKRTGVHKNRKKDASKKACRGKIR